MPDMFQQLLDNIQNSPALRMNASALQAPVSGGIPNPQSSYQMPQQQAVQTPVQSQITYDPAAQTENQLNMAERILKNRTDPTWQDIARSSLTNAIGLNASPDFKTNTAQDFADHNLVEQMQMAQFIRQNSEGSTTFGKIKQDVANGLLTPEQGQQIIQAQIAKAKAANMGGDTGILVNRVMAENPGMSFTDALYSVQTGFRQGLARDANGNIVPIAGAPQAKGALSEGEQSGKERATLNYAAPIAAAGVYGKEIGGKQAALNEDISTLPQLEATVAQLNKLGQTATYTQAGQLRNTAMRETGMKVPQGAVDRAAYTSLVDNQILPLLRRTFGAQFTEKEGATLRATLGDVNKSPEEKSAILRSFIEQKKAIIGSLQRETGVSGIQTMGGSGGQTADPLGIR